MRALRHLLAASALVLSVAGCAVEDSTTPSLPKGNNVQPNGPLPGGTYDPTACAAKTAAQIKAAFNTIVTNTPISGWPSISAFEAKVNNIALLRDGNSTTLADLDAARAAAADLIDFLEKKYADSDPDGSLDEEVDALITDLWCFVGLGGDRFDINPNDAKKDFAVEGKGGVTFPAGFCPVAPNEFWPNGCPGINVFLSEYTGTGSPLKTLLDTYGTYLVVESYPAIPPGLMIALPPTVAVCFNADPAFNSQMYLGHQKSGVNDPSGFSIRPRVPLGALETLLGCPDIAPAPSPGVLGQLVERLEALLLPKSLSAAPMFAFGGVGGSAEEFSPFGAVDAGLMGGAGGSAEEFAPPVMLGPNATNHYPVDNVTRAANTGAVSSGLPSVVVQTRGPAHTKIDGATVNFVLQATKLSAWAPTLGTVTPAYPTGYPAPSSLCLGGDYSPETANGGIATVPCLSFGTKAGYMDLKATVSFDGLDFPGSENLEFCEETSPGTWDCDASGTIDRNWLIVTEAGAATSVRTLMPATNPTPAASYSYGAGLVEDQPVGFAPRVLVTDTWDNPVPNVTVAWDPLEAGNGSVAVVGAGGTTAADGTAQITSWTLGAGASQLNALITGSATPAIFTATTPTGVSGFACAVGGNKADIGWMSIPKPSGTVRDITLYVSITGQSNVEYTYHADVQVRKNSSTGTVLGALPNAGITLPGNNGSPRAITLRLTDPVTTTEMAGTGQSATTSLWIGLTFTDLPPTRKIQVWYNSSITKSNQGPCYNSLIYAPGSITSFKRGLGINVTN